MAVAFQQDTTGLFVVRYAASDDLRPSEQAELIGALEQSPVARKGILFDVGAGIRSVDMAVPNFWLEVTSRRELRLAGMAIVSPSAAVRVAASGFALANKLRGLPISVKAFTDLSEGKGWLRGVLDGSAAG